MPEGSTEMTDILEKIRDGQRVNHFQTTRLRRDGTMVPISLTVSPIYDSTGALIGASSIARDITAQVRGEEEIARLTELHARTQEISKTGGWEYDVIGGELTWTD
jgi:PAS domain-containing protein